MTKKIIATFSSALIVFGSSFSPVLAEGATVELTGNGTGSTNNGVVTITQTTQVSQSNSADISTNINSSSNSGGNNANYNTGGNVSVDTGNATTNVTVNNTANSNVATVDNCNCGVGDVNVKIAGNGDNSDNAAGLTMQNTVTLGQTNSSDIYNRVNATSNSGDNDANHNTGGSVSVSTGNALTKVTLNTNANQNVALVGGNSGNGANTSVLITGNGTGTDNKVLLGLTDWVVLGQTNDADVNNHVYAKANSGYNDADYNTGGSDMFDFLDGDVTVDTGNATTDVKADTAVNFNAANIDCDCLMNVTAKISGNGASSQGHETESTILATLVNGQQVGQANGGEGIDNHFDVYAKSGFNDADHNTAESADPSVSTGDAMNTAWVNNQGNSNVYGAGADDAFPFLWDWDWHNTNVSVTFDLSQLLAALGIH